MVKTKRGRTWMWWPSPHSPSYLLSMGRFITTRWVMVLSALFGITSGKHSGRLETPEDRVMFICSLLNWWDYSLDFLLRFSTSIFVPVLSLPVTSKNSSSFKTGGLGLRKVPGKTRCPPVDTIFVLLGYPGVFPLQIGPPHARFTLDFYILGLELENRAPVGEWFPAMGLIWFWKVTSSSSIVGTEPESQSRPNSKNTHVFMLCVF